MESYIPKHFDFRVRVFMEEPDFGKGVAQLLSLTREKGSLSAAYKSMGMAASKAWKIIKNAESDLDCKLIESTRGGKEKGTSVLTKEGKEICKKYEDMMAEINTAVDNAFAKYFLNK